MANLRQHFIIIILLALVASGCSKKQHFEILGEISDLGAQNVSITYYADGGLKRISTAAVDGRFSLRGESPEPTLCIVEKSDGTEIATVIAANGDKVKITGELSKLPAIKVSGNASSEKLARWVSDNTPLLLSRNTEKINRSVADFIRRNTSDVAATALLVTRFYAPGYELLADSLLSEIDIKARPIAIMQNFSIVLATQLSKRQAGDVKPMTLYLRSDTVVHYSPFASSLSLLAFRSDSRPAAHDSVGDLLKTASEQYMRHRLRVIEFSSARDSASWKRATARDSASWEQAWVPGTVASGAIHRLAVPRYPFFIVADSAGTQLYRGSSVTDARRIIDSRLKKQ